MKLSDMSVVINCPLQTLQDLLDEQGFLFLLIDIENIIDRGKKLLNHRLINTATGNYHLPGFPYLGSSRLKTDVYPTVGQKLLHTCIKTHRYIKQFTKDSIPICFCYCNL